MLVMVLRKMLANKWMVFCLLIGTVLAVGMVSSIPLYTEGVLNRMLRLDLEQFQKDTGYYPGRLQIKINLESLYAASARADAYNYFSDKFPENVESEVPLPYIAKVKNVLTTAFRATVPPTPQKEDGQVVMRMMATPGINDHVDIRRGRLPTDEVTYENGMRVLEAMISDTLVVNQGFEVGRDYPMSDAQNRVEPFILRVVGQYGMDEVGNPFWYDGVYTVESHFVVGIDSLMEISLSNKEKPLLNSVEFYYGFEYHDLNIENLAETLEALRSQQKWVEEHKAGQLRIPAMPILTQYEARETQLRTMLMVLQVPILLMLMFYIFMVAQLIVDYEKNEISVLKSRGASRLQVIGSYLMENGIIGIVALAVGPLLGWFVCMVLGASNGFLELVSRTSLPIKLNAQTILYAFYTVVFTVLMMLIPAIVQSRRSIVEHKQAKARTRAPIWKRFFLDILLILASFYGLYQYSFRQEALSQAADVVGTAIPIDPLLFLISTLFVLGVGLFFLRVYPYFLRGVFALGRRIWPPSMYASFVTVSRSGGQEQFLMIFLILTLSVGIFNANAARTINRNVEEKLLYETGAEMTIVPVWRSNELTADPEAPSSSYSSSSVVTADAGFGDSRIVTYVEPPFEPWEQLDGVELATKVFTVDKATASLSGSANSVARLMAIDSAQFGRVAFMPEGLLSPHWNDYLNVLTREPQACLISRNIAEQHGIKPGDTISVTWARQSQLELRVHGFFDYWPTYNKYDTTLGNRMIVCNLSYVQAKMAVEPYQIWLKRAEDATSEDIYNAITESKLTISAIKDARQNLVRIKNDPMLQGANGAMTMGFIVTMLVSAIGFIIYWILSIKGRVLQFGILRAMGLSLRSLIGMLLWEQLMICGTSILVGVITGGVAANLFVPMLQIVYSASEQVPPFRVVASGDDYIKIYAVIASMLAIGFVLLGTLLSRIRVAQALKLGED